MARVQRRLKRSFAGLTIELPLELQLEVKLQSFTSWRETGLADTIMDVDQWVAEYPHQFSGSYGSICIASSTAGGGSRVTDSNT